MDAEPESPATWIALGSDPATFPIVRVAVVSGPDAGRTCELIDDRLVIGTHDSVGLRLADPTVSRFHCELVRRDQHLVVRDLGSRNGTDLDGVSVREAFARPRTRLTVGTTVLRLDAGVAAVAPPATSERFGVMVTRAPAMRRVFARLERAAASDATVLLLGETETGKEVAAESIHRASPRASGPFIIVDCAAIPAELLESELFGHERGAFTGALRSRDGAFQAARGGTIFLDEIGELPKDLQPKLLRALSRRTVKPVGRDDAIDIDVRVIAATNRDLREEVNADRFRGDLYFRLAVVEVRLPPLRERAADVPVLIEHLLDELAVSAADRARLTAPAVVAALADHPWPGNIRELRNHVERRLALGDDPAFDRAAVAPAADDGARIPIDLARPFKDARDDWTARFERAYLASLLAANQGNIRAASRAAGIDRMHLYRLLAKFGLR